MSALRVAARRLPRVPRFVPAIESPVQRRFATTSNAPQNVKSQVKVCLPQSARTTFKLEN